MVGHWWLTVLALSTLLVCVGEAGPVNTWVKFVRDLGRKVSPNGTAVLILSKPKSMRELFGSMSRQMAKTDQACGPKSCLICPSSLILSALVTSVLSTMGKWLTGIFGNVKGQI